MRLLIPGEANGLIGAAIVRLLQIENQIAGARVPFAVLALSCFGVEIPAGTRSVVPARCAGIAVTVRAGRCPWLAHVPDEQHGASIGGDQCHKRIDVPFNLRAVALASGVCVGDSINHEHFGLVLADALLKAPVSRRDGCAGSRIAFP